METYESGDGRRGGKFPREKRIVGMGKGRREEGEERVELDRIRVLGIRESGSLANADS